MIGGSCDGSASPPNPGPRLWSGGSTSWYQRTLSERVVYDATAGRTASPAPPPQCREEDTGSRVLSQAVEWDRDAGESH